MKNEINQQQRTVSQWEELIERYFDGTLSEKEERELQHFLSTSDLSTEMFDEARAVMGFLKVGKDLQKKQRPLRFMERIRPLRVAALVGGIFLGGTLWMAWERSQNVCEVYIYGTRHTDVAMVMSQMHNSLDRVDCAGEGNIVEMQLNDLFQTMEEK